MPLAYEVLPANTADKTTLKDFLVRIEAQYGRAERVWLMDRGVPITVARDLGTEIAIATGLTPADRIIVTPPDGLADGDQVRTLSGDGPTTPALASEQNNEDGRS